MGFTCFCTRRTVDGPLRQLARRWRTPPRRRAGASGAGALRSSSPPGPRFAQSPAAEGAAARNPDKLVVEANQLVYDKDHNTVSAVGGVELYYKHRVLQADRVVYNRVTKRLYAEGHAKLTDEQGNVTYAKRFDLTDDFAAGFAEGGRVRSPSTAPVSPRRASSARPAP